MVLLIHVGNISTCNHLMNLLEYFLQIETKVYYPLQNEFFQMLNHVQNFNMIHDILSLLVN